MLRRFCDVCKEEVVGHAYEVDIYLQGPIPLVMPRERQAIFELCEKCKRILYGWLGGNDAVYDKPSRR